MANNSSRISKSMPVQEKPADQLSDEALDRTDGRGGYSYANAGRCVGAPAVSRRR